MPDFHNFVNGVSLGTISRGCADCRPISLFNVSSLVLNERSTAKQNSTQPFIALNLQWTEVLTDLVGVSVMSECMWWFTIIEGVLPRPPPPQPSSSSLFYK